MAEKILNTRILMKVDTLENWSKSTLPLKKGELAFATVAASAGNGLTEPVVMVKIGEDGVKTFNDLTWNFYAKASDVIAAAKSEDTLRTFVNSVIADAGIATSDAMEALAGRVTTAEGEIDTLQSEMDAVEAKAAANETAIGSLESLVGEKAVATQISEAIAALDLANTYDAKGAAADALTDAKDYADGLNTAMDTRVKAVEAKAHEHANKAELDLIATGDKAKWDAMEQNAKDYADDLDEAMDGRVAALEAKFGDGEGNVESQIAAAVAAEKAEREAADNSLQGQITANDGEIAGLQELVGDTAVATQISNAVAAEAEIARAAEKANADAIDAIEADYLKAADKTELEGKITTNANAIELLTNGVSADEVDGVNDLIQYVKDHGTEVTGIKADIKTNADDIDALEGRMDDAETAIGTKAAQSDLEALTGRVTTVEGKVTTLEGEMDTAQADITALETKVGDKAVATQITDVTNPLSERVTTLEGKAHEHDNKAVLDGVTAEKVATWDAAVQTVTADTGLKATKTGTDVAIAFDDSVTFVFDCGDSTTV